MSVVCTRTTHSFSYHTPVILTHRRVVYSPTYSLHRFYTHVASVSELVYVDLAKDIGYIDLLATSLLSCARRGGPEPKVRCLGMDVIQVHAGFRS